MRMIGTLFLAVFMCTDIAARLPDLIPYRKGNLWGYCDSTKKIVIEPIFESAGVFVCERAIVALNGLCGIIDLQGEYVLRPKYWDIGESRCNRREAYIDKDHCGLIDDTGRVIIPFIAKWISWDCDNILTLNIDGDNWIYNLDGKLIINEPFVGYDNGLGDATAHGYFIVARKIQEPFIVLHPKSNIFTVIDRNNKELFPGTYDWIEFKFDSLFECTIGDSTAYYNLNGELIPDYWPPLPVRNGLIKPTQVTYESRLISVTREVHVRGSHYRQEFIGYRDSYGTEYWED